MFTSNSNFSQIKGCRYVLTHSTIFFFWFFLPIKQSFLFVCSWWYLQSSPNQWPETNKIVWTSPSTTWLFLPPHPGFSPQLSFYLPSVTALFAQLINSARLPACHLMPPKSQPFSLTRFASYTVVATPFTDHLIQFLCLRSLRKPLSGHDRWRKGGGQDLLLFTLRSGHKYGVRECLS